MVNAELIGFPVGHSPMLHTFSYDGATYMVSFRRNNNQLQAALYRRGDAAIRDLSRTPEELAGFSEEAIRAGYIELAEWLVKCQAVREAREQFRLEDAA